MKTSMLPLALLLATVCIIAVRAPANAGPASRKSPEAVCQSQAMVHLSKMLVFEGRFEIFIRWGHCVLLLQAPAIFEGKRTVSFFDGKTGDLLAEFYGPKDSDTGLCSYRGGALPTNGDCTSKEFFTNFADLMASGRLK